MTMPLETLGSRNSITRGLPDIPINREQNLRKKRVDFEAVCRVLSEQFHREERREKRGRRRRRKEKKKEKVAKKRKRLGDEILESSILRVRGDSRAARGSAAWNRCIREKRGERGSADSWMVMEEDGKRFGGQPYPGSSVLLALSRNLFVARSRATRLVRRGEDSSCWKSRWTCS